MKPGTKPRLRPSVSTFLVQLLSLMPVGSPLSMPMEMAGRPAAAVISAASAGELLGEGHVGGRVVLAAGAHAAGPGGAVVIGLPTAIFLVADLPVLDVGEGGRVVDAEEVQAVVGRQRRWPRGARPNSRPSANWRWSMPWRRTATRCPCRATWCRWASRASRPVRRRLPADCPSRNRA